jgi:hypothetical protein
MLDSSNVHKLRMFQRSKSQVSELNEIAKKQVYLVMIFSSNSLVFLLAPHVHRALL